MYGTFCSQQLPAFPPGKGHYGMEIMMPSCLQQKISTSISRSSLWASLWRLDWDPRSEAEGRVVRRSQLDMPNMGEETMEQMESDLS